MTADIDDARLRSEIRIVVARLRAVCASWPPELFEQMVRDIARVTLKYSGASVMTTYDRRAADRIIEDLKEALERSEALHGKDPIGAEDTSK